MNSCIASGDVLLSAWWDVPIVTPNKRSYLTKSVSKDPQENRKRIPAEQLIPRPAEQLQNIGQQSFAWVDREPKCVMPDKGGSIVPRQLSLWVYL